VVRIARPQRSRRSSHDVLCRTGCLAGGDHHLHRRRRRLVKETRAESEPQALIAVLSGINLPLERIGLEASSLTA
jgi:hypothetical protein